MKPTLRKSLLVQMAGVALACLICAAGIFFYTELHYFQQNADRMRRNHIAERKRLIRSEVQRTIDYIEYMRSTTEARLKQSIRERVLEAHTVASSLYRQSVGRLGLEETGRLIRETLRSFRYNQDRGYVFIADLKARMILQPTNPDMEGVDFSEKRDQIGIAVIREAARIAVEKDQGYLEYSWPKNEQYDREFKKISYVKRFEPLGWLIGSGEYLDDFTQDVQAEILDRLARIRFGDNGYIFVAQWDGLSLIGPSAGENKWSIKDPNGVLIVQGLVAAAKRGGDFVEYIQPAFGDRRRSLKISYAMGVPEWQWCVGTGLYVDDIEDRIGLLKKELMRRLRHRLIVFGVMFLMLGTAAFLLSHRLADRLDAAVGAFVRFFKSDPLWSARMDPRAQPYAELTAIAAAANDMVRRGRRAEEELRRTEASLASVFRAAPVGLGVVRDRAFVTVNERYADIIGYSVEELIGRGTELLYADEGVWRDVGRRVYDQINAAGTCSLETTMVRKDGRAIDVAVHGSSTYSGDPEREFIFSIMDVTARKKAERDLKESEERYRKILDLSPAMIVIIRIEDGRYLEVNRSFEQLTGFSREEVLGRIPLEFHEFLDPADREAGIRMLRETGRLDNWECRSRQKDGTVYTQLVSARPMSYQGEECLVAAMVDITARKEMEAELTESRERYRQILDTSPVVILITRLSDGKYLEVNPAFETVTGFAPEEVLGKTTLELDIFVDIADRAKGIQLLRETNRLDGYEFQAYRKDRSVITLLQSARPINYGGEDCLVSVVVDITDRKEAEAALRESEERYRSVMVASYEPVVVYDVEGKALFVNPAFSRVFGRSADEVLGRKIDYVPPGLEQEALDAFQITFDQGQCTGFETKRLTKDGRLIDVNISSAVIRNRDGEAIGSVVNLNDITERKRTEAELTRHRDQLEEMVRERTRELSLTVDELRSRSEESRLLTRMGDLLQACDAEEESYTVFASTCEKIFYGQAGFLGLMTEGGDQVEAKAGFGGFDWPDLVISQGDCWALRRGGVHIVPDAAVDPTCGHFEGPASSSLCVPIIARSKFIGLIHLTVDLPDEEPDHRLQILNSLAGRASRAAELYALSLANIRLRDRLRRQSILDPLTKLYNRRYMEQALRREINRSKRKKTPIGLMMIDVDHFKRFNDLHGHETGDVVLRRLGRFLINRTRGEDIACRYGGEEMMMILPDCNLENCLAKGEQIRAGVARLTVNSLGRALRVTVSVGVGAYPETGRSLEEVLKAIDDALYRAKDQGRDRVVAAPTVEADPVVT